MRKEFADELLKHAKENKNIILLTGDLGFGLWDSFRDILPEQFYNVGASEQTMLDIAVGIALVGKIPFCYSITPFLLYRAFETWRTYINHESIPVIGIGSGRDKDYAHDGFSHDASDDDLFMLRFKNIESHWPTTIGAMKQITKWAAEGKKPYYINLKR
jgi:transketolase